MPRACTTHPPPPPPPPSQHPLCCTLLASSLPDPHPTPCTHTQDEATQTTADVYFGTLAALLAKPSLQMDPATHVRIVPPLALPGNSVHSHVVWVRWAGGSDGGAASVMRAPSAAITMSATCAPAGQVGQLVALLLMRPTPLHPTPPPIPHGPHPAQKLRISKQDALAGVAAAMTTTALQPLAFRVLLGVRGATDDKPLDVDKLLRTCLEHWDRLGREGKVPHSWPCGHVVPWRGVLCCAVLCCVVLCCAVLCCVELCCVVLPVLTARWPRGPLLGFVG